MNAIVIEQTQDETKRAFEFHQNAAIKRIRLARAKLVSQAFDETPKAPVGVTFRFTGKPLTGPHDILRLELTFRMSGVPEEEGGKRDGEGKTPRPVALVECVYEVDYALREGFMPTPEQVKAFQNGNAMFNAWPYFREYLQDSLLRMGYPPLAAPFLRLQPRPKPRKPETRGTLPREN